MDDSDVQAVVAVLQAKADQIVKEIGDIKDELRLMNGKVESNTRFRTQSSTIIGVLLLMVTAFGGATIVIAFS